MPRLLSDPRRILTLWLPRWPVQRRLVAEPTLRSVPVLVCRRQPRGVMTVACWGWALPPPPPPKSIRSGASASSWRVPSDGTGASGACVIRAGMSLAEAMSVLAMSHGTQACQRAWIDHDDPVADLAALDELARWCRRFTPAVALEDVGGLEGRERHPECLHLDVTATAGFFGGEDRLARTAVWTLAARGIHARGAVADTPGAAWAAAHHTELVAGFMTGFMAGPMTGLLSKRADGPARGERARGRRRSVVVPRGGHLLPAAGGGVEGPASPSIVDVLPAAALRLDEATLQKLREVGIGSIGEVMRLPRRSLASRFGAPLVRRLAQFVGERAEPLEPGRSAELPQAGQTFDFPLALRGTSEERFGGILRPLLEGCLRPLAAAGRGVTALQVRLERSSAAGAARAAGRIAANAPVVVDVGLYRPSLSADHLAELIRLRMSRTPLPAEIDGVSIEVLAAGEACSRQRTLFGAAEDEGHSKVAMLLDRLSGRLGRAAVFEPRAVADAQPEHAWVAVPPAPVTGTRGGEARAGEMRCPWPEERRAGTVAARLPAPERRPIWMLPRPARLDVVRGEGPGEQECDGAGRVRAGAVPVPPARFRWEKKVHWVVWAQGPERIETAWWRGPCIRRDYFLVECLVGEGGDAVERLWIFRRLRDGAWFVHGVFA